MTSMTDEEFAEIQGAELFVSHDELRPLFSRLVKAFRAERTEVEQARKTGSYWKENLNLANIEIETLRQRVRELEDTLNFLARSDQDNADRAEVAEARVLELERGMHTISTLAGYQEEISRSAIARAEAAESLIAPAKAAAEYLDSNFKGNKFYTRAMDIASSLNAALEKVK